MQQPFVAAPAGAPSPGLAAVLGLIPGVGAMYNGQFIKGLIHVVIFAVLVSAAHIYGIFGLFIAGWVCYQVFEAYHTAKARRDGEPLPDPLGLNEIGNMVCRGRTGSTWARSWHSRTGAGGFVSSSKSGSGSGERPRTLSSAESASISSPVSGSVSRHVSRSVSGAPAGMFGPGSSTGSTDAARATDAVGGGSEPIGAVILIALGVLFLMGHCDWFSGRMFECELAGSVDWIGRVADCEPHAGSREGIRKEGHK